MSANSVPDSNEQIHTTHAVALKDRYLVIGQLSESVATYKPYKPIVVPSANCGGTEDASILGHPTQKFINEPKTAFGQNTETEWLAPDLHCVALREHLLLVGSHGDMHQVDTQLMSLTPGEPPDEYFAVPATCQERSSKP